jgi:hypothetical protein
MLILKGYRGTVSKGGCRYFLADEGAITTEGGFMRGKVLLVALLLVTVGACASGGMGNPGSASSTGIADTMSDTIMTYKALEPRLSTAQKAEFKDAYDHVSSAYQTAGTLLASIMDAYDEASAHTSLVAYQNTAVELPRLADKVRQLVQGFKGSVK